MSASPAAPSGRTPNGENRPRIYRRKPQSDPLRPAQRPLKKIARTITPMSQLNRVPSTLPPSLTTNNGQPNNLSATGTPENPFAGAKIYSLVTTKRSLMEGLRYHVMRLQKLKDKGKVDICDESQFTRPVRLHRRDPRAPLSGAGATVVEEDSKDTLEEDKERERIEIAKEERRRIREENAAKIAPSTTKKPPAFQKKTEQIYRPDDTPEAQKRSKLRYEEALPWHLEDFDNKQTWVGSYESELSEAHIMLVPDSNGEMKLRMIPIEKWYKFSAKGKGKAYTAEEADKIWATTGKLPKFLEKGEQLIIKREREDQARSRGSGMRTRVAGRDDDEAKPRKGDDDMPIKREADADDIDFNYEEDFADDEEGLNGLFEGDAEETKAAEEKMRRDRLAARVFDLRNENEVFKQEEEEKETAEKQRKLEKSVRKALLKREKNFDYEESDSNPYSSSSDSEDDSEAERQKEKERPEEEEKKAAEKAGKPKESDKPASGTSTKGTTTPSGYQKSSDPSKQALLSTKKRPGSPNLSEASGNESSRKKHKKKHQGSRAISPEGQLDSSSRKSTLARLTMDSTKPNDASKRLSAISGSDSEMTDGGRKKKKKQSITIRLGGSPNGTPGGSRAGSPDATGAEASRATSPLSAGAVKKPRGSISSGPMPTADEIKSKLVPEGLTINELLAMFKGRTHDNAAFIGLVRAAAHYDKATKKIFPKGKSP